MSSPSTSHGASISQHLRTTKEIIQSACFGVKTVATLDEAEFDAIEQDAFEILRLVRSWRNRVAPINRIPPEILAILPDFWDDHRRDQGIISLTHVCRAWREVIISRSSLWTNLHCESKDKTLVFLERSKSSPFNLSLRRKDELSSHDPFFQITPQAIGRLKSLYVEGRPWNLEDIAAHLSHPAPLLEAVSMDGISVSEQQDRPALPPTLFNGNFPSLRKLYLVFVDTELPWRNMANLTSLRLDDTSPVSARQLLDLVESAPRLQEVHLHSVPLTFDAQEGRSVSLSCLKQIIIADSDPSSVLLSHLLIPVGAHSAVEVNLASHPIGVSPPKFLDNLRNLPDFTSIRLYEAGSDSRMRFTGPNGQVDMDYPALQFDETLFSLECLSHFDTAKVERLDIEFCDFAPVDHLYQVLLPMNNLRAVRLQLCTDIHLFIHALDPNMNTSGVVVCPKLEELVLIPSPRTGGFDLECVIGMAEARALRGAKLRTVRIADLYADRDLVSASELGNHVWHVDYGPQRLRLGDE